MRGSLRICESREAVLVIAGGQRTSSESYGGAIAWLAGRLTAGAQIRVFAPGLAPQTWTLGDLALGVDPPIKAFAKTAAGRPW